MKKNKWVNINKDLPPLWTVVEVKLYHMHVIKRAKRTDAGDSLFFAQEKGYGWIGAKVTHWRYIDKIPRGKGDNHGKD